MFFEEQMTKILETKDTKQLSLDFIAGLITSQGYFNWINQNKGCQKVPVFQLKMSVDNKNLIFAVRNTLRLKEPIYEYKQKKSQFVLLLVRKKESIKKIIIPAFDNRLQGRKQKQFDQWKEKFFQEEKKWQYRHLEKIKGPKIMDVEKL